MQHEPMPNEEIATRVAELRVIWAETLGIRAEDIEDGDDFFDLGGDSMLALEVATEARRSGLDMPLSGVLRLPVLSELAAAVLEPERFSLPTGSAQ